MRRIQLVVLLCAVLFVTSSCSTERLPEVKNVIYLIGDGMGFGAVSSLLLEDDSLTAFEMSPIVGLSETCSANNFVTDSPAGGTALACGVRTLNGYLGVDVNGVPLESILKKAQKMGKKSGIVVNTTLTEATPAAFYAGVLSRSKSFDIAAQFVESNVDVAIGAGLSAFINRPDSTDLTAVLIEKGYDVYLEWDDVIASESDRFVGILPMGNVHRRNKKQSEAGAADGAQVCLAAKLAAEGGASVGKDGGKSDAEPEQYLEKAVAKALGLLEKSGKENGFFLMVESAIIDGYGHNNDSDGMIEEMAEFNRTLKFLVKYVENHPNTLLVVTADHETGGTSVGYKSYNVGEKSPVALTFSTKGHSGTVVPVFAYGEGAEYFGGVMKNTDIPWRIERLMNN
ncbi:MAG: alkaline phosphatase [Bacteroidales bacterium]|nr:alkaline phosphatase [Bacteroidales bacterium]